MRLPPVPIPNTEDKLTSVPASTGVREPLGNPVRRHHSFPFIAYRGETSLPGRLSVFTESVTTVIAGRTICMTREIKLNELTELLESATYPLSVETAKSQFDDVRLIYADGSEPLDEVLARLEDEQFASAEEAQSSIFNTVPVEGVGEPGQSEGEG